jgi:hypothetical protein
VRWTRWFNANQRRRAALIGTMAAIGFFVVAIRTEGVVFAALIGVVLGFLLAAVIGLFDREG